jgi:hypothetical protein
LESKCLTVEYGGVRWEVVIGPACSIARTKLTEDRIVFVAFVVSWPADVRVGQEGCN